VPATLIAEAEVLHLTGIMPGLSSTTLLATRRAVAVATSAGVAISFDVNHRMGVWGERAAGEVYREIAAASAVVFAGEDEARLLTCTDTEDPRRLLGELSALSAGDAVLKRGEHGCWALIGGVEYQCAAVPVPVTDTVGAGDAFVAGYLTELVSGSAPDVRLRTAVQCGAFVCMSPGDWEGLPTRADLAAVHSSQPVRR